MNIKISKKRAREILEEEVEAFLKENKDIDAKLLIEKLSNDLIKESEK